MNKVLPIRLPEKDLEMIDRIVKKDKLFVSRSDFARFAIEKAIFDSIRLREVQFLFDELSTDEPLTKKKAKSINRELREIRKQVNKELEL